MQPSELKAARKAAGLSQHELGELIGLSRVTVGLMERGEAPITARTALAVKSFASKLHLINDTFSVEQHGGFHCVVRRRLRNYTGGAAMSSLSGQTILYGKFNRRDHAYRWCAALTRAEAASDGSRRSRSVVKGD